jgi:transcriptional regulator with XRE-family HTH domain
LNQQEVGFLLGAKHGAKVSRYEQGHRLPPLRTALAYATIFDVPAEKLFPDLQREIQNEIDQRICELRSAFNVDSGKQRGARIAARKAQWFAEHHDCDKKMPPSNEG